MKKIVKDKNKSEIKAKIKILVLGLILLVVVGAGLFSPTEKARATVVIGQPCIIENGNVTNQSTCDPGVPATTPSGNPIPIPIPPGTSTPEPLGSCDYMMLENGEAVTKTLNNTTKAICDQTGNPPRTFTAYSTTNPAPGTPSGVNESSTLYQNLPVCFSLVNFSMIGCIVNLSYWVLFVLPAWILAVTANIFNFLVGITLSNTLYTASSSFIPEAWRIVRDLSNIFFILILIYIAVKLILGLGGSDVKKMIVTVVIMALLINFSMFFTKIVIDTSNIIALIFYNRIAVNSATPYTPISGIPFVNEKDIGGAIVSGFNPARLISPEMFTSTTTTRKKTMEEIVQACVGPAGPLANLFTGDCFSLMTTETGVPNSLFFAIIVVSCVIFLAAAYAFFIAGFSFLTRLIELWVLIIISPFAFMSLSIPELAKVEYIGWDAWRKRLFTVAFMAPIFMFFLYIIAKIVEIDIFKDVANQNNPSMIAKIIFVILPASVSITLLLKAAKFAEKGGGWLGEFAENAFKGALGVATGVAVGGGIGAIGALGQGTLGHLGKGMFESTKLIEAEKKGSRFASALRTLGGGVDGKGGMAGSSFDLRKGVASGLLSGASKITGLNLATSGLGAKMLVKDGGYEADLKRRHEYRKQRADGLKTKEGEEAKQNLNKVEDAHQTLLQKPGSGAYEIQLLDNQIKVLGERSNVASRDSKLASSRGANGEEGGAINPATGNTFAEDASIARSKLADANGERSAIKNATMSRRSDGTIVDHRDATTNGNLSEDAITGIVNTASAAQIASVDASFAASQNLADPELAAKAIAANNASIIANAARDAALAAKDVTLIDNLAAAVAAAAANPTDLHLAEAVEKAATAAANASVTASTAVANQSATTLNTLATAPGADASLIRANAAAADALTRIANGLTGKSINNMEDTEIPKAKYAVENISKERARAKADIYENSWAWPWNRSARKKSAHDIRMGVALDSGTGGKGGGN